MKIRNLVLAMLCGSIATGVAAQNASPLYKDAKAPIEERINDLISRMTIEEKVGQLNQYTLGRNDNANNMADPVNDIPAEIGSLIYFNDNPKLRNYMQKKAVEKSRLGIPILFGYDVIHGYRTVYPISIAQACSWNTNLVEQASAVSAQESRMSGIDWTFSPMIDVARDPRWGRVAEGYGEDPYTNAVFAVATVKGYQGDNLADRSKMASCLKHYIGYGASEAGRDYVYTEISKQTLWDTYMLPYEEGVKAGAATLMSSFNDISGTPGSANKYTMTDILKTRWKHDGFVVSDWGSIEQLRPQGVAADKKEAAMKAINAGLDMDMMNRCYDNHLAELVKEGKVSQARVDDAVRRVLRIKFRLGLFETPYTPEMNDADRFLLPKSMKIAEKLAEESIVLLKNENNVLPLSSVKKIAVIGPMIKNRFDQLGSWSAQGKMDDVVTILQGLEAEYNGKAEILNAQGCDFDGNDKAGFADAVALASKSDVVVLCLGEKKNWSGENASRATIELPQIQQDLLVEIKKAGKPVVLLISSGRPLALSNQEPLCDAIVQAWQPGITAGKAIAGIVSGRVNPSGKLSMTFPRVTGQIPIYYNHRQSARPHQGHYQDIAITPLYDFAYGLSYTDYTYGEPTVSSVKVRKNEKFTVEVSVTNSGKMDGAETVHWFVTDPVSTISRPVKELRYFEKKEIKTGETKVYRFDVDPAKDLSFVDGDGNRFVEPGVFFISVKDKKVKVEVTE